MIEERKISLFTKGEKLCVCFICCCSAVPAIIVPVRAAAVALLPARVAVAQLTARTVTAFRHVPATDAAVAKIIAATAAETAAETAAVVPAPARGRVPDSAGTGVRAFAAMRSTIIVNTRFAVNVSATRVAKTIKQKRRLQPPFFNFRRSISRILTEIYFVLNGQ